MAIENRVLDSEDLNIKDLNLGVQEAPQEFNLNRDITPEQWKIIESFMNTHLSWTALAELRTIRPGCLYKIVDKPSTKSVVSDELEALMAKDNWRAVPKIALAMKQLYPKEFKAIGLEGDLDQLALALEGKFGEVNRIQMARELTILFPDKAEKFKIPELNTEPEYQFAETYAGFKASQKIVAPEKFKKAPVSKENWKKMKYEFQILFEKRQNSRDYLRAIKLAYYMGIISAEEIKITDNGLELTISSGELAEPAGALPQFKTF